jgi:thiol-disulfide isomerase/thioredoxin
MIKYINSVIILIVLILLGFIIFNKFFKYTNDIPTFSYTKIIENSNFTNKHIPKNKETVIVYVSTKCGSCENTVKYVNKNIDVNKNYIIVTSEKQKQISEEFFKKFSLNRNIILLNDENNYFSKDFKLGISVTYPTIFVFDKGNKLINVSNNF